MVCVTALAAGSSPTKNLNVGLRICDHSAYAEHHGKMVEYLKPLGAIQYCLSGLAIWTVGTSEGASLSASQTSVVVGMLQGSLLTHLVEACARARRSPSCTVRPHYSRGVLHGTRPPRGEPNWRTGWGTLSLPIPAFWD